MKQKTIMENNKEQKTKRNVEGFQVRVPEKLAKKIRNHCDERGYTVSSFFSMVFWDYFENNKK